MQHSHRNELHRYLLRRSRRPQDVDDFAQEVYLRLLRHDNAKLVRKPLAYLYGIASHVIADYMDGSEHERECVSGGGEDGPEDASSITPDDLADQLNLQQQIERALARLPPPTLPYWSRTNTAASHTKKWQRSLA